MRRRAMVCTGWLVMGFFFGACGGDDSDTPGGGINAPDVDPCALITREEAEAFLGKALIEDPLSSTNNTSYPARETCIWVAPNSTEDGVRELQVNVYRTIEPFSAPDFFDQTESDLKAAAGTDDLYQPVQGLGDGAFFDGLILSVKYGQYYLAISLGTKDVSDLEQCKTLRRRPWAD